jgi:hypothetical protein
MLIVPLLFSIRLSCRPFRRLGAFPAPIRLPAVLCVLSALLLSCWRPLTGVAGAGVASTLLQ